MGKMSDGSCPQPSALDGSAPFRRGIFSIIKSRLAKAPTQSIQKSDKQNDEGKKDAEKKETVENIRPTTAENVDDSALGTVPAGHNQGLLPESAVDQQSTKSKSEDTENPQTSEHSLSFIRKNSTVTAEFNPIKTPEPSQETNYLYIQMNKSFKRTTKEAFALNQQNSEPPKIVANLHQYVAVETAVGAQNFFHNTALFVQGMLAGLSLAHVLFAFSFKEMGVLIYGYQWLAIFAQAIFYAGFVISSVDALDRFEIGTSMKESIRNCLALQGDGLCILIYFCGSACSVLMTPIDELIASNNTDVLKYDAVTSSAVNTTVVDVEWSSNSTSIFLSNPYGPLTIWRWLSTVRAACATIGWLILTLRVNANFTRDYVTAFMVGR